MSRGLNPNLTRTIPGRKSKKILKGGWTGKLRLKPPHPKEAGLGIEEIDPNFFGCIQAMRLRGSESSGET